MEATFPYSGNAFFNKSFIPLVETDLLSNGNGVFFYQRYFSAGGIYYWNKGERVFKERAYSCWWTAGFGQLAGIFQRLLARKSFISASGNGF